MINIQATLNGLHALYLYIVDRYTCDSKIKEKENISYPNKKPERACLRNMPLLSSQEELSEASSRSMLLTGFMRHITLQKQSKIDYWFTSSTNRELLVLTKRLLQISELWRGRIRFSKTCFVFLLLVAQVWSVICNVLMKSFVKLDWQMPTF